MTAFTGWPVDATAFLAEIARDNSREFWHAHGHRHAAAVLAPMRALAAELEPEFGPVRVLKAWRNRRFRPDIPPYRTDTGGVVTTAGGVTLAVLLSAAGLTVTAGQYAFDAGQIRRYRAALDASDELPGLVAALDGLVVQPDRSLTGLPRGFRADHPRIDLLRRRGLLVGRSWTAGAWLGTPEPLERVRAAWRAAAPLVGWLETHVGPAAPVPPRPHPPGPAPALAEPVGGT